MATTTKTHSIATKIDGDLGERLRALSKRTQRPMAQLVEWSLRYSLPAMEVHCDGPPVPPTPPMTEKELLSASAL